MNTILNLDKLYNDVFGKSYKLAQKDSGQPIVEDVKFSGLSENMRPKASIDYNAKQISLNKKSVYGLDIWFPVEFRTGKLSIEIEACTIGVNLSKTIIRTAVSERRGTVKEVFAVDDYKFTVKGFIIGKDRFFPETEIQTLKDIFESTEPVTMHGGYPEIFLDESCRIIHPVLDFPETQGKAHWIRPFSMTCESDYIHDLIII